MDAALRCYAMEIFMDAHKDVCVRVVIGNSGKMYIKHKYLTIRHIVMSVTKE